MRQAGAYSGLLRGGISGRTGPRSLHLARIKKIMKKSGEDVKMISGEAPIVFAKACDLFIGELARRSWTMTIQGKRRTLHREDVASAVIATDLFDFWITLVYNSDGDIPVARALTTATVMEMEKMKHSWASPAGSAGASPHPPPSMASMSTFTSLQM